MSVARAAFGVFQEKLVVLSKAGLCGDVQIFSYLCG